MSEVNEHIGTTGDLAVTGSSGIEAVRTPLVYAGVNPDHGHRTHFRTQIPIRRSPRQNATELSPGSDTFWPDSDSGATKRMWRVPEPTRKRHFRTLFETVARRLTGSWPTGERGESIEARPQPPIIGTVGDHSSMYNDPPGADAIGIEPQPIAWSPPGSTTDDIAQLLQSPLSEPHEALKSFRANFPFVEVMPLPPQTRTIPLPANTSTEIIFPDLAVIVRVVAPAGVDVWYSRQGAARIPQAGDMGSGNVSLLSEGMILNLDPTKYYYAKSLKGLSAISAVQTFVNVQAYLNA